MTALYDLLVEKATEILGYEPSQKEIAELIGVSEGWVSLVANGDVRGMQQRTARKIAAALHVPLGAVYSKVAEAMEVREDLPPI